MKRYLITIFIILSSVAYSFGIEIIVPEECLQGRAFTVFFDEMENPEVRLRLRREERIYSETMPFIIEINGRNRYAALLGVPSTLSPGECIVDVVSGDNQLTSGKLMIIAGEFISEEIPLNRSMSSLRKSDDARKTEQWRNLLSILKTVNPESVYETGGLNIPIDSEKRTSFFGDRRLFRYSDGSSARSIHNGVDYSAEPGTEVFAAGRGRVVFAGERIISGHTVVIEHLPGVYSLYYHLNSILTEEGLIVEKGEPVGTVGSTGLVTGAHLHWEVRAAGVAVNPEALTDATIIDKSLIISSIE